MGNALPIVSRKTRAAPQARIHTPHRVSPPAVSSRNRRDKIIIRVSQVRVLPPALAPTASGTYPAGVLQRVLLALCIAGFVVPNVLLGIYIADEGMDVSGYFSLWTDSTPSTQITLDLVIAAVAFLAWAAYEGPRARIERWWLCIPATLLVGLCFGLPLFLLMRERTLDGAAAQG